MKRLKQDALHLGTISELSETNPELTYDFIQNESIEITAYNYSEGDYISKWFPVEVK